MRDSLLLQNISIHNKIAKKYESIHGEIYNAIEQERLKGSLSIALDYVTSGNQIKKVLDFGCGAGNLTKHLTDIGCEVVAGDVSQGFLDLVSSRSYKTKVDTLLLNGVDLSNIPDESFDMVVMYSVLHHVPDYLSLMKEFVRVLKKGGVLCIDHEHNENIWNEDISYINFKKEMSKKEKKDFKKYFIFTNYIDRLIRVFINPKYQREGDIHVFKDDHIMWGDIRKKLEEGVEILHEEDYLVFRNTYDKETYDLYKNKTNDIHLLIARK